MLNAQMTLKSANRSVSFDTSYEIRLRVIMYNHT